MTEALVEITSDALEAHRRAVYGHCYRMLGSVTEADDAVQETLVRAWNAREKFGGRSALGSWLYRIATNVCLDALGDRKRRERPIDVSPPSSADAELVLRPSEEWIEPVPDSLALPAHADPAQQLMLRQSIRLAFVAALQHLPPRQRAALLSTEVLGMSAAETAECLDTSVASVNSAVQRARATLATQGLVEPEAETATGPLSASQLELVDKYVVAFERHDVDALTALMREDAIVSMPPLTLWLQGLDTIRAWMRGRGAECRGSRLVPTAANGHPAFGQYRPHDDGYRPWCLTVLELRGDRVASTTSFLDVQTLFPIFGLPDHLER